MRFVALFLVALICLQSATAVSLRRTGPSANAKYAIERLRLLGKQNAITSKIVAAVELSITNGDAVDLIIELLTNVLADVTNRKQSLVSEWNDIESSLQATIDKATSDLVDLNADLAATNQEIEDLNNRIDTDNANINQLQNELDALDQREQLVNASRDNDINAYAKRKERDQNAIDALNEIIPALNQLLARGNSFLQVSKADINKALKKIPRSNPIQALVQLSTKFDEQVLTQVIGKLQNILDAIIKGAQDDAQGEVDSKNRYDALIAEIHSTRAQKQADLVDAQTDLAEATAALAAAEAHQAVVEQNIADTTDLLNSTVATLATQTQVFNQRIAEASQAVDGCQAALNIVQQHEAQLHNDEAGIENRDANLVDGLSGN